MLLTIAAAVSVSTAIITTTAATAPATTAAATVTEETHVTVTAMNRCQCERYQARKIADAHHSWAGKEPVQR